MERRWLQLFVQFVAMLLLYLVLLTALEAVIDVGFVHRIVVALVVAVGFPQVFERFQEQRAA